MQAKQIEKTLTVVAIIGAIALWVIGFVFIISFSAPEFESVQSDISQKYTYTTDDGDTRQSVYHLAWHHQEYKKPYVVLYDSTNGHWSQIRSEYYDEIYHQMPKSQYASWWRHCMYVWGILLCGVLLLGVFWGGPKILDVIIYMKIKQNPNFEDCTWYLNADTGLREPKYGEEVSKLLPLTSFEYIKSKQQELIKRYNRDFVNLILQFFQIIAKSESTTIPFLFTLTNNVIPQQEKFLQKMIEYNENRIGIDPNAEQNIAMYKKFMKETYEIIPMDLITTSNLEYYVCTQLNKLFTEIMGSEIFSFSAYTYTQMLKLKKQCLIDIDLIVWNTSAYFERKEFTEKKIMYPGIRFEMNVYQHNNGTNRVKLWHAELPCKCNYSYSEDSSGVNGFSSRALYQTMFNHTISSFMNAVLTQK